MRLIKLSANKDTFRTVKFNAVGLNLIVGRNTTNDPGRTYNGVGKSLLLCLVDFCLGANASAGLIEALPGWAFSLEFAVDGTSHYVTRSIDDNAHMTLNGEVLPVTDYVDQLQRLCFPELPDLLFLTFRSLIKHFLRPRKDAYLAFDTTDAKEQAYAKLLTNAYLLGLNTELVSTKYDLKKRLDQLSTERAQLKKATRYLSVPKAKKEQTLVLQNIDERIDKLTRTLEGMQISDNFRELEERSQALQRELKQIRNQLFLLHNSVLNIDKSLQEKHDIPVSTIQRLYEEVRLHFPEAVLEELSRVETFHNELLANRRRRLTSRRDELARSITELQTRERSTSAHQDELLKYLKNKGILREYSAVNEELADLKTKASLIREYMNEVERLTGAISASRKLMLDQTEKANEYLREAAEHLAALSTTFRRYAHRLYPNSTSGLTAENNENENQLRFEITAHVENDSSDGINEAKIFCYDLTLISTEHTHKIKALFHDSRLFSDIDPRQTHAMFSLARELSATDGFQYIASLNQNTLDSLRSEMADDEQFNESYLSYVILELTDESPEMKLLGIDVDMDY